MYSLLPAGNSFNYFFVISKYLERLKPGYLQSAKFKHFVWDRSYLSRSYQGEENAYYT